MEKKFKKNGNSPIGPSVHPRPAGDQRLDAWTCGAISIFLKFSYLKKNNFWKFGRWTRAFGRMGVQHLHFLKLTPTLEVLILPKFMESGDFTFFPKLKILNLDHTWTFISIVKIFVS
jgi:hypothetical protein